MRRDATLWILLALSLWPAFARAGGAVARVGRDAEAYVTVPARWRAAEWSRLALTAGSVGGVMFVDQWVRRRVLAERTEAARDLARLLKGFGEPLGVGGGLAASVYLGGWLTGDPDTRETGFRMLEAGVFSLAAASVLKVVVGRSRPERGEGAATFRPLRGGLGGDRSSFPSGHTTFAFAVAAVAAERVPGAGWVAYPLAALVGWSRLHDDEHWASDVAAGAVLGAATGWWVAHREEGMAPAVTPWLAPRGAGLAWHGTFR
ncbi:MAG: phosphatase PAP2 family protein [Deltaproteobacteria bacterium]|nr:phosphatase PAP2 family protein [Deltaproteobacteria bacterium]